MKTAFLVGTIVGLLISTPAWAAEQEAKLNVSGLFCADCVSKVQGTLEKTPGVISAHVNLDKNQAVVKYDDSKTNSDALAEAVTQAGFESAVAR